MKANAADEGALLDLNLDSIFRFERVNGQLRGGADQKTSAALDESRENETFAAGPARRDCTYTVRRNRVCATTVFLVVFRVN
jgi:hypothetical protein